MKTFPATLLFGLMFSTPLLAAEPQQQATDTVYRTPVTALTVEKTSIARSTRLQGIIESTRTPQLKSHVSAEVVEVNVDEGDTVKQGDRLARLDDESFRLDADAAKADIARLDVRIENLRRTLTRIQSLRDQKLTPQSQLDDASAAVREAEAQRAQARARLAQAKYQLSQTRIVAPLSGVVQQRTVSVGDYVNPMSPSSPALFQLVDTQHLRARLYFPESLADAATLDMPVTLHSGGQQLTARITRLRPMLEQSNRALHALADFDNSVAWLPGQTITADVVLAQHENVIVVPEQAVVPRRRGEVVYRLHAGKAEAVPVRLGLRQDGHIEIVSGLNAGDRIAIDGAAFLADGVPVAIQNESKVQP